LEIANKAFQQKMASMVRQFEDERARVQEATAAQFSEQVSRAEQKVCCAA
jgi:hypothetical protein